MAEIVKAMNEEVIGMMTAVGGIGVKRGIAMSGIVVRVDSELAGWQSLTHEGRFA